MNKKILLLILLLISINVNAEVVKFDKCIDGDTMGVYIKNEYKKVRFLSINAPEIDHGDGDGQYYGEESKNYVCDKIKNAKSIELEYDDKSDKTDKYGRVLAWVWVDGELLQKDLVSNGYAEVKYVYDNYKYSDELKELEKSAKEEKIGMWSDFTETVVKDEDKFENSGLLDLIADFISKIFDKLFNLLGNML